ncbi:MFS transporter [Desulfovibrio sp. OttesenSCG-928-O18]|nr:MFS transporter [Desulfovibrio sp. OttesenSCG-928-O18]
MVSQGSGEKIFTKNFMAVAVINFLIMLAYYLLFVVTGPYVQERFLASPSTSGLVAGLMVLGSFLGRFLSGYFIGVFGARKSLLTGILIYCAGMAMYVPAGSLLVFFIVRLISGIGIGCINTVTGTVIAHILPEKRRGLGISYFSLSTVIALALGPFLGLLMQNYTTFQVMFLCCLAGGLISLAVALFLSLDKEVPATAKVGETSLLNMNNYLDSRVVLFGIFVMIVGASYGNVQAFMSGYAKEINMVDSASMFFLVYALTVFLTRPYTGKVFDMHGEHRVFYPALVLLTLGLLTLSFATSTFMMIVAGAFVGAGFGNILSIGQAVSLKLVPRHRFAQATSTFYVLLDCGVGFGPYFFGFLVPVVGYQGMFFVSTFTALVGIPLYYFLHARRKFVAPE